MFKNIWEEEIINRGEIRGLGAPVKEGQTVLELIEKIWELYILLSSKIRKLSHIYIGLAKKVRSVFCNVTGKKK